MFILFVIKQRCNISVYHLILVKCSRLNFCFTFDDGIMFGIHNGKPITLD